MRSNKKRNCEAKAEQVLSRQKAEDRTTVPPIVSDVRVWQNGYASGCRPDQQGSIPCIRLTNRAKRGWLNAVRFLINRLAKGLFPASAFDRMCRCMSRGFISFNPLLILKFAYIRFNWILFKNSEKLNK